MVTLFSGTDVFGVACLYVNCNDVFYWGCADAEDVTPENLIHLADAVNDCDKLGVDDSWGGILFCARIRKMRPQGAAYPSPTPENFGLRAFFDECGPEREIDFLNPYDTNGNYLFTKEMHEAWRKKSEEERAKALEGTL